MSSSSVSMMMIPCPELKRENVRRCLFGRPDPQKLSEELKRQEKAYNEPELQRFREKWSFDPVTGPLKTGPYEFIPVEPLSEIPSFYTKGYPPVKSKPVRCRCLDRLISAKRKLELGEQDENLDSNNHDIAGSFAKMAHRSVGLKCQSVTSSSSPRRGSDLGDGLCSKNNSSLRDSSQGLTRSSSEPTLLQLSPRTLLTDIVTPPSKPKVKHQSSITDYMPHKKQRVTTKLSPHT